jgi:heavy metal sensor kinase
MHLRPPPSLRARLALWYLLVLGTVLILFGTLIFVVVRQSLLASVDNALLARADTVMSQVSIGPSGVEYQGGDAPHAEAEMAIYLFDPRGRLLDKVAGSSELPPHADVVGAVQGGQSGYSTVGGLRLYSTGLRDNSGHLVGVVQVIQSLDSVTAELDQLLTLLLVATPFLLIVATAGGIFLAGRALRPIDRITSMAREIGAGNLTGRLGLAPRDDEVGRLAATFDGMLDRLERAFTQQRQFAADASHELRTPLTIIKGDLDVLLRRRRSPDDYEEVARAVDDEVTRLSLLVEDLLTLARADSGQAELAREFVYFDALVTDAAAGMRRLAEAKGLTLEARLEQDVAIIGDPARLRQLVLNLLGNAVKYTAEGGHITVTLGENAGWAILEVVDTGIGIASEDLPHIFDRFFRADKARARAEGGTGLGLAIARWCAEAHGGRIEVDSHPGKGSVFRVWLPLAQLDSAGATPRVGAPSDALGRGSVPGDSAWSVWG